MHVAGNEDDEPEIVVADAMTSDPIIGTEALLHDGHGPGARPAVPIKAPAEMTPAQWEAHVLTHLPFCPGCPYCVMARKPNLQHRRSHEGDRTIPMLVADYGYIRDADDTLLATVLVLRLYPYRLFFATIVNPKGPDNSVVDRVAAPMVQTAAVRMPAIM